MSKIAVITGTSYGLGEAISKQLLAKNFKVYGISRSAPKIKNPQFVWIKADLTNNQELSAIPAQISEAKIDLLVNNAGHLFVKKTLAYTDTSFEKMFGLNFKAPVKMAVQLFPKLNNGLIINLSSDSDRYPDPDLALYGSSKAALNLFFETMAEENQNVKIINLLPTYIDTQLLRKFIGKESFDWNQCLKPEQVAESIIYILKNHKKVDSGSRIMLLKNDRQDGVYNPEKLWIYFPDNQRLKKVS